MRRVLCALVLLSCALAAEACTATIKGSVFCDKCNDGDKNGADYPIANVPVKLTCYGKRAGQSSLVPFFHGATTNAAGGFTFTGVETVESMQAAGLTFNHCLLTVLKHKANPCNGTSTLPCGQNQRFQNLRKNQVRTTSDVCYLPRAAPPPGACTSTNPDNGPAPCASSIYFVSGDGMSVNRVNIVPRPGPLPTAGITVWTSTQANSEIRGVAVNEVNGDVYALVQQTVYPYMMTIYKINVAVSPAVAVSVTSPESFINYNAYGSGYGLQLTIENSDQAAGPTLIYGYRFSQDPHYGSYTVIRRVVLATEQTMTILQSSTYYDISGIKVDSTVSPAQIYVKIGNTVKKANLPAIGSTLSQNDLDNGVVASNIVDYSTFAADFVARKIYFIPLAAAGAQTGIAVADLSTTPATVVSANILGSNFPLTVADHFPILVDGVSNPKRLFFADVSTSQYRSNLYDAYSTSLSGAQAVGVVDHIINYSPFDFLDVMGAVDNQAGRKQVTKVPALAITTVCTAPLSLYSPTVYVSTQSPAGVLRSQAGAPMTTLTTPATTTQTRAGPSVLNAEKKQIYYFGQVGNTWTLYVAPTSTATSTSVPVTTGTGFVAGADIDVTDPENPIIFYSVVVGTTSTIYQLTVSTGAQVALYTGVKETIPSLISDPAPRYGGITDPMIWFLSVDVSGSSPVYSIKYGAVASLGSLEVAYTEEDPSLILSSIAMDSQVTGVGIYVLKTASSAPTTPLVMRLRLAGFMEVFNYNVVQAGFTTSTTATSIAVDERSVPKKVYISDTSAVYVANIVEANFSPRSKFTFATALQAPAGAGSFTQMSIGQELK